MANNDNNEPELTEEQEVAIATSMSFNELTTDQLIGVANGYLHVLQTLQETYMLNMDMDSYHDACGHGLTVIQDLHKVISNYYNIATAVLRIRPDFLAILEEE